MALAGRWTSRNTEFEDLPAVWQAENREAAEFAVAAVLALDDIETVAERIHVNWLSRNGEWAPVEQKRPYADLAEAEKEKDRVVARIAADVVGVVLH